MQKKIWYVTVCMDIHTLICYSLHGHTHTDMLQFAWTYTHSNVPSPALLSHMPKAQFSCRTLKESVIFKNSISILLKCWDPLNLIISRYTLLLRYCYYYYIYHLYRTFTFIYLRKPCFGLIILHVFCGYNSCTYEVDGPVAQSV